nr:hypothetical protein [Tanacetum cinerariifolium]
MVALAFGEDQEKSTKTNNFALCSEAEAGNLVFCKKDNTTMTGGFMLLVVDYRSCLLCMRTRSSSNLVGESSPNPTISNPKCCNRRRSKQPFILEESPVDTMADQRSMVELLRAPTEGDAEAIVVPPILAEHFKLKHSLINMMTSDQFFGLEKDNPYDHIYLVSKFINEFFPPSRTTNLCNRISNFKQRFNESFYEAWDRYKGLLRACPHHGFTEFPQLDTFYNALNPDFMRHGIVTKLFQMNTAFTSGSGHVPSNTIANPKGKLKAITTRSGLALDGPFVPMPLSFINSKKDERAEATLTDSDLAEYTIKVPPPLVQKAKPPSQKNYVKLLEKLGDPEKFLISCGFSLLKCKALADLGASINLMPLSVWKKVSWKFTFLADFVIVDYESDPLVPLIFGRPFLRTVRALIYVHGEEMILRFTDELALIIFSPKNDDLPFDIESDLREIKYLLNHDPTKEMDSILEDLIDKCNLADLNNDLVDTILEMFIDEHTLDYSSPPLYDDMDDDLVEFEFDDDDIYDDPFNSKEDKMKECKLLIDELDPPRSSDFLPSLENDSVLYADFSEVDALPLTNNEDKVFNPGILIHENLYEVINRVAPDKNVKKISISNASLILEDFNPPLCELPFHKEVPWSKTLLSFSSKNEEKVFKPKILSSKGIHTYLL